MIDPIRIVQLYPDTLGITGDRGNVRSLVQRLERAGVPATRVTVGPGDPLPDDPDVIVLGNGPLSAMRGVIDDLLPRADALKGFVAGGGPLLAVGGSAELLGSGIDLLDGTRIEGLGVLPYRVERTRERRVGYILVETPLGRVIGFEDHASRWHLEDADAAFGTVANGNGSFRIGETAGEIVRVGAAYATNVQGPALPLNPAWSIDILRATMARRGIAWDATSGAERLDEYAAQARSTIERLLHGRAFNAIKV